MKFLKLFKEAQFHGALRLADAKHRYFWLLAQLMFFGCSVTVIYVTVNRFFSNPTYIVKLASIQEWKTFPTIIICPETNYAKSKIDHFLDKIVYPPETNKTYIRDVIQQLAAFYSPVVVFNVQDLENIQQLLEYNNLDVESAGLMLSATCDETIIKCSWRARDANCSSLFQMELTSFGYCCVFNGRSFKRELKDPEHIRKPVEKTHINNIGRYYGLNVAVAQNVSRPPVDINLAYKWISMKNSGNMYVDILMNGTPLPPGLEIWAGFSAETMQLTDEVRSLSRQLRRCYLTDEPLKYFPNYHRPYCVLECEMERVAAQCQCALVHHPPVLRVPVCRARELGCARAAAVRLDVDVCDCPLACDNDRQIIKQFSFALESDVPTYDPFYDNLNLKKVSIVRFYIHGHSKKVYSRRSYFSKVNLFAQLGGVFNVFFGCSILTLLELLILLWRYIRERLFFANRHQTWPFKH